MQSSVNLPLPPDQWVDQGALGEERERERGERGEREDEKRQREYNVWNHFQPCLPPEYQFTIKLVHAYTNDQTDALVYSRILLKNETESLISQVYGHDAG